MDNNIAAVIDSLCSKFGTTIDNLLPAIVEFGKYDCQLTARICTYFVIFGLIALAVSLYLFRKTELDDLGFGLCIVGFIAVIVGTLILVVALAELNEWNHFPEVMAYKYIIEALT